jgi:hypothetical protein
MSPKNKKCGKDIEGDQVVFEGHHWVGVGGKMIVHGRWIGKAPKWAINAEHRC